MTTWDLPETVAGFVHSPPNGILMQWAERFASGKSLKILDIGCGAGRNSIPLAARGHRVTGIDSSIPMLEAARHRALAERLSSRLDFQIGSMEKLDVGTGVFDLIVAHGIWNLAASDHQLMAAAGEAARAGKPGAGLFVFTFSRSTLASDVLPVTGQRFVYSRFSGAPQVFLTESELTAVLSDAGFELAETGPLTEYNRPLFLPSGGVAPRPVLWEGTWTRR